MTIKNGKQHEPSRGRGLMDNQGDAQTNLILSTIGPGTENDTHEASENRGVEWLMMHGRTK